MAEGNQIFNKVDINQLVPEFIKYYLNLFVNQPNNLQTLFKPFTNLILNGVLYKENIIIPLMELSKQKIMFDINTLDYQPSGSRRCNIMLTGKYNQSTFIQYLFLCFNNNQWWIQEMIIRII